MICEKNKCTGCFACYNVCPKNAIKMVENEYGYIYPEIDKDKCINCNLCRRICPSINKVEQKEPKKCYAMYSKDENIRKNSTSGGAATIFSRYIIQNGGVVYGASFENNCVVSHVRIDNTEGLHKLQGSKYVHSYIKDTYKEARADLLANKQVLFIGTPCQIAGLKSFLKKDYENLILIDIICHGVPSQKYLQDEVIRVNKNLDIDRVSFRHGNKYGFAIVKEGKTIHSLSKEESPYADSFMQTLTLRENCYNCKYANPTRVSDITIGDFWGLKKESKFYQDREKGVSTLIISTDKGMELVRKCEGFMNLEERNYEEAVNGNTQLRVPAPLNKNYSKFRKYYLKYGFNKAYKKSTFVLRMKRKIKGTIKKALKKK